VEPGNACVRTALLRTTEVPSNDLDDLFSVAESPLTAAQARQDVRRILREEALRALALLRLFNAPDKTKPTRRSRKGN